MSLRWWCSMFMTVDFVVLLCAACKITNDTVCVCVWWMVTTAVENSFTTHTWIHKYNSNNSNIWHHLVKMRKLNNFQCNLMKCNFISSHRTHTYKKFSNTENLFHAYTIYQSEGLVCVKEYEKVWGVREYE